MINETSEFKLFNKESLIEFVKSNPANTFISIHDNVYDVTSFLDEVNFKISNWKTNGIYFLFLKKHPGGEETLKEVEIRTQFRDATESFEDTGHSMDARDMMKKYQIGTMVFIFVLFFLY